MISSIEWLVRELHKCIESFKNWMGVRLREVYVPDLSSLCKEVALLKFEMRALAKNHLPVNVSVILFFMQQLSRPAPMFFDLFTEDNKAPIIGAKRGREKD